MTSFCPKLHSWVHIITKVSQSSTWEHGTRTLATALFGVGEVEAWFSITERWKGKIHPAAQTNIMEFKPLELRVKSEKQKEIWTLFDMYTKQQHATLCKNTYKQKDAC